MQRGYVLCNYDLSQVLCLTPEKDGVVLHDVTSTKVLNKAMCLPDLTEAKNVSQMLQDKDLTGDLEIVNVARLYKKFF
ncbi:hypothetical protein EBT25_01175 [bacterium]|jgi:hypothetical protein|nr:hypothetical protein [bacterium]